jgi:uncharacterized protein YbbC (DUF1343 family)
MFGNGIDNLQSVHHLLAGKRLGLVTNHTGLTLSLTPTADILREQYDLRFLVGPEHGVSGVAQAGAKLEDSIDTRTGLPVISLFRGHDQALSTEFPEADMLVLDLQDVGLRFYTYTVTLYYVMVICARTGMELLVLDRYNPLGLTKTEGTPLEPAFASHIGKFPIPTRHALTMGEYAQFLNDTQNIGCKLHICRCTGLTRQDDYFSLNPPWVAPSPNLPTADSMLCYIGTCQLEGTNLSTGRGTTKPFEQLGAPWLRASEVCKAMNSMQLPGVLFREADFVPTFHRFKGEHCHGLQLHITDRTVFQSFRTAMLLIQQIRNTHAEFEFVYRKDLNVYQMDILLGKDDFRRDDCDVESFILREEEAIAKFLPKLHPYRIY